MTSAPSLESLQLLRKDDTVAVMVFGKRTKVRLPLTADRSRVETEIKESVNDREVGAETAINDAIVTASEYLDRSTEVLGARFTQASHRVELAQASARFLTTLGLEVR